ncbi:MAG: hypothetical protein WA971_16150, partial [Microbacterium sp.]
MVAHVLQLRLALLRGAVRGAHPIRAALGLLATIAATIVVGMAVLRLADGSREVAHSVIVLGSAAVFLAFLLGPVLIGAGDQLDPRRFAVFGVDDRKLPGALALATVVSVPSVALIAVAVCIAIVVTGFGAPWPVTVLATVIGVGCTLLAARIGMAVGALLLPERRSRELTALFVLAVIVVAFPVAVYFASQAWDTAVPAALATATAVAGAT